MALITVKNPNLYNTWVEHLCRVKGVEYSTPQIRTEAFFNSQAGNPVPVLA